MLQTTLEKATVNDAEQLTAIMKKTFDFEAEKWLSNRDIIDYNIQPPGYTSIEMTKYMIRELEYFKVMYDGLLVGGIIATQSQESHTAGLIGFLLIQNIKVTGLDLQLSI